MGTQLSLPKGAQPPPQFSAHVYCGQTAGWGGELGPHLRQSRLGRGLPLQSPINLCELELDFPCFASNAEKYAYVCGFCALGSVMVGGRPVSWVTSIRYLEVYTWRVPLHLSVLLLRIKTNSIRHLFGQIGHITSEEVIFLR